MNAMPMFGHIFADSNSISSFYYFFVAASASRFCWPLAAASRNDLRCSSSAFAYMSANNSCLFDQDGDASDWIETFMGDESPIRYNAAALGHTYDKVNDAFIAPKNPEHGSWKLDDNFQWKPPIPYPQDGENHRWDDDNQKWIQTTGPLEKITIHRELLVTLDLSYHS